MAWGWSHTPEAYQNFRGNLGRLQTSELITISAEWLARIPDPDCFDDGFSAGRYRRAERRLQKRFRRALQGEENPRIPPVECFRETLIEQIYDNAESIALCTNGGFSAWACPYGCGPHLISFSRPDESDYERE